MKVEIETIEKVKEISFTEEEKEILNGTYNILEEFCSHFNNNSCDTICPLGLTNDACFFHLYSKLLNKLNIE